MEIRYIDYAIGFFVTEKDGKEYIELNQELKRYPKLHQQVLEHELGHNTGKKMDFWHDLKDAFDFKKQWELTKFTIRHPSALLALSPVLPDKGINWFMTLLWAFAMVSLGFTYWILG